MLQPEAVAAPGRLKRPQQIHHLDVAFQKRQHQASHGRLHGQVGWRGVEEVLRIHLFDRRDRHVEKVDPHPLHLGVEASNGVERPRALHAGFEIGVHQVVERVLVEVVVVTSVPRARRDVLPLRPHRLEPAQPAVPRALAKLGELGPQRRGQHGNGQSPFAALVRAAGLLTGSCLCQGGKHQAKLSSGQCTNHGRLSPRVKRSADRRLRCRAAARFGRQCRRFGFHSPRKEPGTQRPRIHAVPAVDTTREISTACARNNRCPAPCIACPMRVPCHAGQPVSVASQPRQRVSRPPLPSRPSR